MRNEPPPMKPISHNEMTCRMPLPAEEAFAPSLLNVLLKIDIGFVVDQAPWFSELMGLLRIVGSLGPLKSIKI